MKILLTNDDGFDSPFLAMLCRAAASRGHTVTVCAPHSQQSGKSQSFTMTPLRWHERQMEGAALAFSLQGTPADCTRVGFKKLCGMPDVVISGMNKGYNVGFATFVSGTVGAAREAAFYGIPALAVSVDWSAGNETALFFAGWAIRLAERMLTIQLPPCAVVNINVPPLPPEQLKEPVLCPINQTPYEDDYDEIDMAEGENWLQIGHYHESDAPNPGSDLALLGEGHITVSLLTPCGCRLSEWTKLLKEIPE